MILLLASFLIAGSTPAHATPAEVLIIRHGEKLTNDDGDEEGSDLSPRGYQRADALVQLFKSDSRFTRFGTPVAIFAGSPKKNSGSNRPLETIAPTAKALGIKPITSYLSIDFVDMVSDVLKKPAYDGKSVLISWPHDEIPDMAHEFGVKNKNVPKWKGKTFDRVWRLDFDKDGDLESFDDLPQHLLPGDSSK